MQEEGKAARAPLKSKRSATKRRLQLHQAVAREGRASCGGALLRRRCVAAVLVRACRGALKQECITRTYVGMHAPPV